MCSCKNVFLILGVIGAVLAILGCVLGFAVFPSIVNDQIIQKVQLKEGTDQYNRWVETPVPFTFKVYIFHVENPEEVLNEGAKPKVTEKGPYVYKQYRNKRVIHFNETEDTIEYYQALSYEFDEVASSGHKDTDEVTVLNVPLQGVLQMAEEQGSISIIRELWKSAFPDGIFHKIQVGDLLFKGYKFCDTNADNWNSIIGIVCNTIKNGIESNTIIEDEGALVFSFFNHKQRELDGPYVIKAGNLDHSEVGSIQSWKGDSSLDIWEGGEDGLCNTVRGTDSSIYPPFNTEFSSYEVFNSDICRIVTLNTEYLSSYEGIDGYVAKLDAKALSNSEHEGCYCTNSTRNLDGNEGCFPNGFGDLKTCTHAPVIMSFPHFLWVDDNSDLITKVDGLSPDEEKHSTFVMIEPNTGTPLKGAKRMQFNMVIRPITTVQATANINPAMMPILWAEEGVELSEELIQQLKDDYFNKLIALDAVTYTLIGVGAFLFVMGFGVYIIKLIFK